jgi:hypothetical protein
LASRGNLAHPRDLARPRLLNLNSAAAAIAAGCLMSLGAPLSFAAARGAMLNDGLCSGRTDPAIRSEIAI